MTAQPVSSLAVGVPRETRDGETRVALTPDVVKKLTKWGFKVRVEKDSGLAAGFPDKEFEANGAQIVDGAGAWGADLVWKINRPSDAEVGKLKSGAYLFCLLEPFRKDGLVEKINDKKAGVFAMELIPRTSRAQSMDVLSSQANIAGYRAVIEATTHYRRFASMMMTAAGSSKPAKLVVLGAGVAGLQAIGQAKRMGCAVEAYDVRPEVKEQIQSLGAKFIDINVGEEGSGTGGYAKELSEEGKRKQQQALTERLMKADIIVSTANIPGRKAPILITEEAVKGMRFGSVIVDMAAANGGNCPLSEADKVTVKHGVTLVGHTNYPGMVPTDASAYYAKNIFNLMGLMVQTKDGATSFSIPMDDDIIQASLITNQGEVRRKEFMK